jgi:uncharacterized delta-60 repeat protein
MFAGTLFAQPADRDITFDVGKGFMDAIDDFDVHADGRIVAVGEFTSVDNVPRNYIARLHRNGALDLTYVPVTNFSWINVLAHPLAADGSIIVGGSLDQTLATHLNRIDVTGAVDPSFHSGTGFQGAVNSILRQPDGRLIVGGQFRVADGESRHLIARLDSDGTLDESFITGGGFEGFEVSALALQPDGKIIVTGSFQSYDGNPVRNLVRLNSEGSLDATFSIGSGLDRDGTHLIAQPDGRIIVAGEFKKYNGTSAAGLVRINGDGSIDGSFTPGSGANSEISGMALQSDGRLVVIGGGITEFNQVPRRQIVRINKNGSVDDTFDPPVGFGFCRGLDVVVQNDGKILAGGLFLQYGSSDGTGLIRLNGNTPSAVPSDVSADDVMLAPNPATGAFMVTSTQRVDRMIVRNLLGQTLSTYLPRSTRVRIDLSDQPPGMYLIEIQIGLVRRSLRVVRE